MEHIGHWAESLVTGDRVTATLRHKTDGKQNKHNVPVIVISVDCNTNTIIGHTEYGSKCIPFNELSKNHTK